MKSAIYLMFVIVIILIAGGALSATASGQVAQFRLSSPSINVEATASAIRLAHKQSEMETATQKRLQTIQAQIEQTQQALDTLTQNGQAELRQSNSRLATLDSQIEQSKQEIHRLQATIVQLQQTISTDETNYHNQLLALQQTLQSQKSDLQKNLETVSAQLQAAYVQSQASPRPPEGTDDLPGFEEVEEDHPDDDRDDHDSDDEHDDEEHDDDEEEEDKDEDDDD